MEQIPTKIKLDIRIICIVVALIIVSAFFIYLKYIKNNNVDYISQTNNNITNVIVPFGTEGNLSTISMKIHGYKKSDDIYDHLFGKTISKEKTSFFLVDTSVTNISKQPITFYPDGVYLIDKDGIKYNTYQASSGGSIGLEKTAIDGRDLGYQIEERGNLVYEISNDFEPYAIAVEKAQSNEVLLFELN